MTAHRNTWAEDGRLVSGVCGPLKSAGADIERRIKDHAKRQAGSARKPCRLCGAARLLGPLRATEGFINDQENRRIGGARQSA